MKTMRSSVPRSFLWVLVTLCVGVLGLPSRAEAQCPGVWLGHGVPGTDGTVQALAVLPGGDVIVGGDFTTAGGVTASRIARVNPTRGAWSCGQSPRRPKRFPQHPQRNTPRAREQAPATPRQVIAGEGHGL